MTPTRSATASSAWIEDHRKDVPDADLQIENIRYDLAELQLAVGNFVKAKALYDEIGGAKPWEDPKNGKPLKVDLVYGLARAYEGLAEQEGDPIKQKQLFETAFEIWSVILEAVQGQEVKDRADTAAVEAQKQLVWDRPTTSTTPGSAAIRSRTPRKCITSLTNRKAIIDPELLGGKDAALQQKFEDLWTETAKIAGVNAAAVPARYVDGPGPGRNRHRPDDREASGNAGPHGHRGCCDDRHCGDNGHGTCGHRDGPGGGPGRGRSCGHRNRACGSSPGSGGRIEGVRTGGS